MSKNTVNNYNQRNGSMARFTAKNLRAFFVLSAGAAGSVRTSDPRMVIPRKPRGVH
jgi:hypothetical protein